MSGPEQSALRLRRVAAVLLGRSLREVADPSTASRTAVALGATADPVIVDAVSLDRIAAVLAGTGVLTRATADRLTTGLGLPPDTFEPGADFAAIERDLLTTFLHDRGVVEVYPCRGRSGRTALLDIVGVLRRAGTGAA